MPLLGTSSAERCPLPRHCLFQAVAHYGAKCGLAALAFIALASPLFAADPDAVAATVGSDRIRAGEVQRLAAKATRGKKFDAESVRILQAQVLEEVISRRLVLAYARRTGETPSDAELAALCGTPQVA